MNKIYIGDIYEVTNINVPLLNFLTNYDVIDDDNKIACKYKLIKEDAKLVYVDGYYVDVDGLESFFEINNLDDYLNNSTDEDIFLKETIYKPHIGTRFVKNIRKEHIKKLINK